MDCLKLILALLLVGILAKALSLTGPYLSIRQRRKHQDERSK